MHPNKPRMFNCIVCGKFYDYSKSRADYRGYCSAKCENAHEKMCGYDPKKHKRLNSPERKKWHDDYVRRRETTPGADPYR